MNALAYQTRENFETSLKVVPRTDLSTIRINTLVPGFTYLDQFGLPTKIKADNGLKL